MGLSVPSGDLPFGHLERFLALPNHQVVQIRGRRPAHRSDGALDIPGTHHLQNLGGQDIPDDPYEGLVALMEKIFPGRESEAFPDKIVGVLDDEVLVDIIIQVGTKNTAHEVVGGPVLVQ